MPERTAGSRQEQGGRDNSTLCPWAYRRSASAHLIDKGKAPLIRMQQAAGANGIGRASQRVRNAMAETTKLSVEKALNKLREADAQKTKAARQDEQIDALDEEIKRMRAQRLRLEARQRRSTKHD